MFHLRSRATFIFRILAAALEETRIHLVTTGLPWREEAVLMRSMEQAIQHLLSPEELH